MRVKIIVHNALYHRCFCQRHLRRQPADYAEVDYQLRTVVTDKQRCRGSCGDLSRPGMRHVQSTVFGAVLHEGYSCKLLLAHRFPVPVKHRVHFYRHYHSHRCHIEVLLARCYYTDILSDRAGFFNPAVKQNAAPEA